MKKLFTILTVVALTTTISFAQFSAKAGLNMANIVTNIDGAENGMKIGMIIGGNYAMEISDAMSLNISAVFKQSGTKETSEMSENGITVKSTSTVSLNYLDISPSVAYHVSDAISLSVGPYLAYAMSGKSEFEYTAKGAGVDISESLSESIKFGDGEDDDGIKAMDFGLNIGASYSINDAMSVSAGYALGLSNLSYEEDDLPSDEEQDSVKNSAIYLTFGYTFGN
jgi:hypothetical protein